MKDLIIWIVIALQGILCIEGVSVNNPLMVFGSGLIGLFALYVVINESTDL